MQQITHQIHKFLLKNKKTIAAAESCTGGLASSYLTALAGSSAYFLLGVVAYSNSSKEKLLKIPVATIRKNGAVSSKVAFLMAQNTRKIAKSDFGIGITGIAGPAGGSKEKPAGTVFIAVSSSKKDLCQRFLFSGNRTTVRKKAALKSLELLKLLF